VILHHVFSLAEGRTVVGCEVVHGGERCADLLTEGAQAVLHG